MHRFPISFGIGPANLQTEISNKSLLLTERIEQFRFILSIFIIPITKGSLSKVVVIVELSEYNVETDQEEDSFFEICPSTSFLFNFMNKEKRRIKIINSKIINNIL